jgi:hypothetical protein
LPQARRARRHRTRRASGGHPDGHLLKDPDATIGYHTGSLDAIRPTFPNAPVRVSGDIDAILRAMEA